MKFDTDKIIRFGPPRTGTTLIYNLLKEIFPEKRIINSHYLVEDDKYSYPIVISYRDPRDILVSLIRISFNGQISQDTIDKCINKYKLMRPLHQVLKMHKNSNVLFLLYKKFHKDFDYIFDRFEDFFDIKIEVKKREELKEKYDVTKMKKIADTMKSFDEYDKNETLIHGKHISDKLGSTGQYKDIFNEELQEYINIKFKSYIKFYKKLIVVTKNI